MTAITRKNVQLLFQVLINTQTQFDWVFIWQINCLYIHIKLKLTI